MSLNKIGFIGLGLIGGSIAKKLHLLHPALEIIDKYDKAVEGNDAHAVVLAVRDIISTICPGADVVDVVRCKDCKCFEDIQAAHFCNKFGGFVTKEDYCSRIERKDG